MNNIVSLILYYMLCFFAFAICSQDGFSKLEVILLAVGVIFAEIITILTIIDDCLK